MSELSPKLPLRCLVAAWFSFSKYGSLHYWLLGESPELARSYLPKDSHYLNYHTLHDVYMLLMWVLAFIGSFLSVSFSSRTIAITVIVIAGLRLHELLRSLVRTLLKAKDRKYRPGERTFAIIIMAYSEPIFMFAIMHACLPTAVGLQAGDMYSLGVCRWDIQAVLHYSIACYTTVGWGGIHAMTAGARILSSVQTVYGILMLVFAITSFISRSEGP